MLSEHACLKLGRQIAGVLRRVTEHPMLLLTLKGAESSQLQNHGSPGGSAVVWCMKQSTTSLEASQTRSLLVISRSKFVNDKWMIKNGFLNDVQEHKPW